MGHEPEQCLLLQLRLVKGGEEQAKEWGPAVKFPALKLWDLVWGGGLGRSR